VNVPDSEPDHGTVALVGTVHVSKDSRRLVQDALDEYDPDVVAVVGRGHVEGIRRHLDDPDSIDEEHRERPPFVHLEGEIPERPWANSENIVEVA
jgi:pheromone shutdown protein TraB